MCKDIEALWASFDGSEIYARLYRWLKLTAEYVFQINYAKGGQNAIEVYLPQSVDVTVDKGIRKHASGK